jgi:hypothetical protein
LLTRVCGVAVGLFVVTQAAGLARQAPPLPAGRDLVARHVAAIGGAAAYKAVKSIHATGTFELTAQGISGVINMWSARPAKMLVRTNIPQIGLAETAYDGKVGWELDPLAGPSLSTGRRLLESADDAWFDAALLEPGYVKDVTTMARTEFDHRPAYQVKVVLQSGSEQMAYFDVDTGLELGVEATRDTAMGVLPTTSFTRDYKKFGALLHPTTHVLHLLGFEQVVRFTTIEHDTVPANTFDVPPQVKALIR